MKYLIFLFLAAACFESCIAKCVQTHEGRVSGVEITSRKGRKFWAYSGIPYAEAPVGPLRFRSPVPKKPWKRTLKAHKDGSECLQNQNGIRGSEDCLFLNVYSPDPKTRTPIPVMVYINTGGFERSNASEVLTGPQFLLDEKVVLVTFNYRLGVLGYLSTGDAAAPGNFGLKDQVLVLQWVQRNIRAFGGNPDDVTLFGQGASVHLHTLSDKSKHLFKKVIAHSELAIHSQSFTSDPTYYQKAKDVAAMFNCSSGNSHKLVDCLRQVDARKIINTLSVFDEIAVATSIAWLPTKEPEGKDAFLTNTPVNIIRERKMKNCPIITGNVKHEGTSFTSKLKTDEKLYDLCVKKPVDVIKRLLQHYEPLRGQDLTNLATRVKNFYLGEKLSGDKDTVIYNYTLLVTDFLFLYPEEQFLDYVQQAELQSVYNYNFEYRGALSYALPLGGRLGQEGVAHKDDLFYIFPMTSKAIGAQYNIQRTEKDYKIVDIMIDLWTSFSATSVPNSSQLSVSNKWVSYTSDKYLQIGYLSETTVTLRQKSRSERLQFWYDNVPPLDLGC